MRAIRILKISRHFEGLKIILTSLMKSMSLIFTLCLFALSFIIFMGLFPLKYLKGMFYTCKTLDSTIDLSHFDSKVSMVYKGLS